MLNKFIFTGRLCKDPRPVSYTNKKGEQRVMARLFFAVDYHMSRQKRTSFIGATVYGVAAEKYVLPYMKKGDLVSCVSKLVTDAWKDESGETRYRVHAQIEEINLISHKKGNEMEDGAEESEQEGEQQLEEEVEDDEEGTQILETGSQEEKEKEEPVKKAAKKRGRKAKVQEPED